MSLVEICGVLLDVDAPKFSPRIRKAMQEGWYETRELSCIQKMLKDGHTILEIGAGCGFISSFLAKNYPRSRVIAVEADPELIPIIRYHHDLNGVSVELFQELLGVSEGMADFFINEEFWGSRSKKTDKTVAPFTDVVQVPVSIFSKRLKEWQPQALIVDIEGGELELFSTALPPFIKTVVVECHQGAYGLAGIKRLMDNLSAMGFAYVAAASTGPILGYRRIN